jgi:hypothetical protein
MTIAETTTGDKGHGSWKSHMGGILGDWVLIGILVLSSSLSFGLGLLAAKANAPKGADNSLWIEQLPAGERGVSSTSAMGAGTAPMATTQPPKASKPIPPQPAAAVAAMPTVHNYVASKSGTKYYLPSCGTVSRIKEENRVYFATKADAEKAGYQPSTGCKGL